MAEVAAEDQRRQRANGRARRRTWRRGKHFVTTNALGAADMFQVGKVVEVDGRCWRVTRLGEPLGKWGSIYVYGVRI